MNELSIGSYEEGNFLVFKLAGEIDVSNAKYLQNAVLSVAVVEGKGLNVAIDMENVPFMDSSGVNSLIRITKDLRANAGKIVVINPSSQVRQVFSFMALDKMIPLFASIEEVSN